MEGRVSGSGIYERLEQIELFYMCLIYVDSVPNINYYSLKVIIRDNEGAEHNGAKG